MGKIGLGITLSILLIACGSNAENSTSKTLEVREVEKQLVINKIEKVSVIENVISETKENSTLNVVEEIAEVKGEVQAEKEDIKTIVVKEVKKSEVAELNQGVQAILKPSHDTWNSLTLQNVTAGGKVNYKGMKTEMNQLLLYLSHLQNTPPKVDWTKNEKLAYWINLYNASTVYLIASNYPTTSITKLNGGKPWDKKFVKSGTKIYSLNQIENEIVRPRFKDPRIHAALNCAAVSCPKMLNGAFLPAKLSAQLDQQSYAWINDASRNEVGPNKLILSKIFEWYGDDFTAGGGVVKFVNKYNRTKIIINPKANISYKAYNWDLNE
jgi:hypothetical protein